MNIKLSKKQWQLIGHKAGWVRSNQNMVVAEDNAADQEEQPQQDDQNVARTILQQLGGNKFLAMTGARNLLNLGHGLSFKLPKRSGNPVNYVKITLDSMDLYTMEFGRVGMRKGELKYTVLKTIGGLYFDQLQPIFTETTGLYTHL